MQTFTNLRIDPIFVSESLSVEKHHSTPYIALVEGPEEVLPLIESIKQSNPKSEHPEHLFVVSNFTPREYLSGQVTLRACRNPLLCVCNLPQNLCRILLSKPKEYDNLELKSKVYLHALFLLLLNSTYKLTTDGHKLLELVGAGMWVLEDSFRKIKAKAKSNKEDELDDLAALGLLPLLQLIV